MGPVGEAFRHLGLFWVGLVTLVGRFQCLGLLSCGGGRPLQDSSSGRGVSWDRSEGLLSRLREPSIRGGRGLELHLLLGSEASHHRYPVILSTSP